MTKKLIITLALVVAVTAAGAAAWAHGPGSGRGYGNHMGYGGYGYHMGYGGYGAGHMWDNNAAGYDEATAELAKKLYNKRLELNNVLNAGEIDEAKAKALTAEIADLQKELSQKRLDAAIEFKKRNPDLQTGYGRGYGMGYGGGYGSCRR